MSSERKNVFEREAERARANTALPASESILKRRLIGLTKVVIGPTLGTMGVGAAKVFPPAVLVALYGLYLSIAGVTEFIRGRKF